jgi:tRNA A37 threonylcarbamoyladenosine dehydratase
MAAPISNPPPSLDRFGGLARLYGRDALEKLDRAHVCIVGLGGE